MAARASVLTCREGSADRSQSSVWPSPCGREGVAHNDSRSHLEMLPNPPSHAGLKERGRGKKKEQREKEHTRESRRKAERERETERTHRENKGRGEME